MENEFSVAAPEHAFNSELGRNWLKSHLVMGPIEVVFTKKDGTTRKMNCTLKEELIPAEKKVVSKSEDKRNVTMETLAVWDLDNNGWRSFRLDSITSVKFEL